MGKLKEKIKTGAEKVGDFLYENGVTLGAIGMLGVTAYVSIKQGDKMKDAYIDTMKAEQARIEDLHSHQEETYTRLIEALSETPNGTLKENSDIVEF